MVANTVPNNILQNVQTYQRADMAWMLNEYVAIAISNKKFKNFQNETAQLGSSVTFELTPRFISFTGLVITEQPTVQRLQTLVCSQAANVSQAYTNQQLVFNVDQYIAEFGMAGAKELGTLIETDILKNIVSGVVVSDPQASNYGQKLTNSGPYRFYGDGVNPINSYTQLAQAIANFNDYGAAKDNLIGILPEVNIPAIIGTGLNQFAPERNNDIAVKWMLGEFAGCKWTKSNLLPIHISGSIGNATGGNNVVTLVSTNDPTGANVTQIVVTEPTSSTSATAIKAGDMFVAVDGVTNLPDLRFRQFIGHQICQQPVQFVAIADAASTAGTVTITLRTTNDAGLVWAPNQNQNLNVALQAGMKFKVIPSHRAGVIMSGNPLYVAMPQLPDEDPYMTANEVDPDSGMSIRHYKGSQFGKNVHAYVRDAIWGSTLVPENSMRLIFPL